MSILPFRAAADAPIEDVEIPIADDPEIEIAQENDPETAPEDSRSEVSTQALMTVLPANFPLPHLLRFVPDVRLKAAADQARAYALSIEVTGQEGVQRADLALTALRSRQAAISEHFKEPADLAYQLHRSVTGRRSEWLEPGEVAVKTVGSRIYAEQQRLNRIAEDERRRAQAEADRVARELAAQEVQAAEDAGAPPEIVEALKQDAVTAQAAPVPVTAGPAKLRGNTSTETWKATLRSLAEDAATLNPTIDTMTAEQRADVIELLKGIIAGREPITAIELNWSALNKRAASDKAAFAMNGLKSVKIGGVRSKPGRRL